MRVIVAMDSFKGSLSSLEAGEAVKEGILKACPTAEVETHNMADGGEGTAETIIRAKHGLWESCKVHDPLGRTVEARYGVLPFRNVAVIESAQAIGLCLLRENERNPMETSSFGLGEMIVDAMEKGYRKILITLGGSATNDGGVGMLRALGYEFLDKQGNPIPNGAAGLRLLAKIKTRGKNPLLSECRFSVACDVKNPLCGKLGCSYVFAPQKGAKPEELPLMDAWIADYAAKSEHTLRKSFFETEGSGAAGGLGFAFGCYLKAKLCKGAALVMQYTDLEEKIKNADFLVTGEGSFDDQSCMGKAPFEAAKLAKRHGKTVVILAGSVSYTEFVNKDKIDGIFPIVSSPCSLEEAMDKEMTCRNLKRTAEQIFHLITSVQGK